MKAAVYEAFGQPLRIQNVPDPAPGEDAVVVRVKACGICRSDWHGWMGHDPDVRVPHVPGHELAGVVEEVGKNVSRWSKRRQGHGAFCLRLREMSAVRFRQPSGL